MPIPTTESILDAFHTQHGFDPFGLYCSVTGKRIGSTDSEELDSIINLIRGDGEADAEQIADDLAMRILASMRPSLKWNKFREDSLATMRKSEPVETLAYLINRMFAPQNRLKVGIENLIGYYAARIRCFQAVMDWGVTDATNTLTYMLLEIDAKWNLDTESAPFNAEDFFLDAPTMQHRVEMVQAWYANRMQAWEKRVKAEEMMVHWYRNGNALARPAFASAYMESKPLSATAIKAAAKKEEKDFFAGVLYEIMKGKEESAGAGEPATPAATFVPIRKMPGKFGVKKNG